MDEILQKNIRFNKKPKIYTYTYSKQFQTLL